MTHNDIIVGFQVALKNPDSLQHRVAENILYVEAVADDLDPALLYFVDRPFCELSNGRWGIQGRADDVFYDLVWQQRVDPKSKRIRHDHN